MTISQTKTLEALECALTLILDENCWTQGELVLSSDGFPVDIGSPESSKYTLAGALATATHRMKEDGLLWSALVYDLARNAIDQILLKYDIQEQIHYFNDTRSHAFVIRILREAIASYDIFNHKRGA